MVVPLILCTWFYNALTGLWVNEFGVPPLAIVKLPVLAQYSARFQCSTINRHVLLSCIGPCILFDEKQSAHCWEWRCWCGEYSLPPPTIKSHVLTQYNVCFWCSTINRCVVMSGIGPYTLFDEKRSACHWERQWWPQWVPTTPSNCKSVRSRSNYASFWK